MPLSRSDFMKLLGISAASLLLARCQALVVMPQSPRERLRNLWLRFGELASKTRSGGDVENKLGQQMAAEHRLILDELVASGEITAPVADLVQESYGAAVQHVWRSNAPITCYLPAFVDYAPTAANTLVKQSETLSQLAGQGSIDPNTLSQAQAALEHDMAFYELTPDETQALYSRLMQNQQAGQSMPSFDSLPLELGPDARDAARFILDLLAGK